MSCRDKPYSVYDDQEEGWLFESLRELKHVAVSPQSSPHPINGFTPVNKTPKMDMSHSITPVSNGPIELPQVMIGIVQQSVYCDDWCTVMIGVL